MREVLKFTPALVGCGAHESLQEVEGSMDALDLYLTDAFDLVVVARDEIEDRLVRFVRGVGK